jgi:hypothetical protein
MTATVGMGGIIQASRRARREGFFRGRNEDGRQRAFMLRGWFEEWASSITTDEEPEMKVNLQPVAQAIAKAYRAAGAALQRALPERRTLLTLAAATAAR